MKLLKRTLRSGALLLLALGFGWACGFDNTLREYLDVHFWLPFSKQAEHFEKKNVRRISVPYAGMVRTEDTMPLGRLRAAYQEISAPDAVFDPAVQRQAVAAARADQSLTRREREEVELIDAKIDMRAGQPHEPEFLLTAKKKLTQFLRTARTPEFLSEARGWLAHVHYLLGEQTAAGKIYLDELNRSGSNLSRETILNSLYLNYGYDGGQELLNHLEEYFDTPEHAAFAIQLVTNPHWSRNEAQFSGAKRSADRALAAYTRMNRLLESHSSLLQSQGGARALALLTMRTALRMGDPPAALRIAEMIPPAAAIRTEPDFDWMVSSAHFLSREYAAAEAPLLSLFRSARSSDSQKAAAAYGLCGVYEKTKNPVEQIHFALWLHTAFRGQGVYLSYPSGIRDQSVYWASSGWDLSMLLDAVAPAEALERFLKMYPDMADVRIVKYSLAVRLARDNRYDEAAEIYQSIQANRRAARTRQLAGLYREANRTDLPPAQAQEAKYRLAEFVSANPDRIYFNDALWSGLQRYALVGSDDSRLTGEERKTLISQERRLKDDQEERWRAYLLLREVVRDAGQTDTGRRAAKLALHCLRGISDRFERRDEIRRADIQLSKLLRQ